MPGGQPRCSPLAIPTAPTLRAVFRLALRRTEGLIGSTLRLLGLELAAPAPTWGATAATSSLSGESNNQLGTGDVLPGPVPCPPRLPQAGVLGGRDDGTHGPGHRRVTAPASHRVALPYAPVH